MGRVDLDRSGADAELRGQRQAAALRADRSRREHLFPLLESNRALQAMGRTTKIDRKSLPSTGTIIAELSQGNSAARITIATRPNASRRSFTDCHSGARASSSEAGIDKRRRCGNIGFNSSPFHPHARSASRICSGTGAVISPAACSWKSAPRSRANADATAARPTRRAAVDIVAENRQAHLGAMHAQLMRAAGQRLEREPRQSVAAPHHLPGRRRRLPFGSGFIHQPRVSSSLPSGMSMRPSSASGAPSTTAQ